MDNRVPKNRLKQAEWLSLRDFPFGLAPLATVAPRHPQPTAARQPDIQHLSYQPQGLYPLDLEIFRVSDLRKRVGGEALASTYRYAFPTLIFVTEGTCIHLVDFEYVRCGPGSVLVLRPGTTHSFGDAQDWDGWMVLFRPEFLWAAPPAVHAQAPVDGLEGLDGLPPQWALDGSTAQVVAHTIAQMHHDTQTSAASLQAPALLRYQLYALLTRLRMAHEQQSAQRAAPGRALQRFKAFELLVEKHFATWHQLPRYAQQLGCSEKSLVRASVDAAGVTPKAFISARVVLEAKRLLAHTVWPVARVAESLGYNDLANFAKFFKREAGCTPTEFRNRQTTHHTRPAE